jgi:single-strand DNA-binding protein
MNNLNSILIEGNLVRDPEIKTTPEGTTVCNMELASNRYYKENTGMEKEVSFFAIQTWSKLGEACSTNGKKGRSVRVVGRLKQDRWTGSDGKLYSKIYIVAEHVEFKSNFKNNSHSEETTGAA